MNKEIVAVIPVKGQSERVKAKNIRPFHDTTLYELKLKQLQEVEGFSDKIVSSENDSILEVAEKYGYSIHKRDPKYSTSDVPMSDVYSYVASEIQGEYIAWVNVTNPLAQPSVYARAIQEFNVMPDRHDCLLSVYELKEYIFYQEKPLNFPPAPWLKSQDLEGTLAMSFIINILRREDMVKWGSTVGSSPYFFVCDHVESSDVDYQHDFDFCEYVYKSMLDK